MKRMSKLFAFVVSLIMVLQVAGMAFAKPKDDAVVVTEAVISLKAELKEAIKDEKSDKEDAAAVMVPMGITYPRGGF